MWTVVERFDDGSYLIRYEGTSDTTNMAGLDPFYDEDFWDQPAQRDYAKAHPRMGKIPANSDARPEPLEGQVMCHRCRFFFWLKDGPDGRYGGYQRGTGERRDNDVLGVGESFVCNDCLVDGLAAQHKAWADIVRVIARRKGR